MDKLTFKLDQFEGPLDLLLFLISKHKLDIYDIEISRLLEQYLAYLDAAQQMDLEVASEFLEMASRLVHIKTVQLLPRHEEESEQLRQELTGELLEYQACKQVAAMLGERYVGADLFVRAQADVEPDLCYTRHHSPNEAILAYLSAMGRAKRRLPPPKAAFSGIVQRRVVPVAARILHVLKSLYRRPTQRFEALFEDSADRSELVATFLAVLELVKNKRIQVSADNCEVHFQKGRSKDR